MIPGTVYRIPYGAPSTCNGLLIMLQQWVTEEERRICYMEGARRYWTVTVMPALHRRHVVMRRAGGVVAPSDRI